MLESDLFKLWLNVYDGEGDPPAGDPPAGDPPAGDPPAGDPPAGGGTSKQFSQDDVNRFLASEKRKWKDQQQKAIDELEALRAKANLTDEERQQYDERIENMKNQLLTKDQLTEKEKAKLEKAYKKQIEDLTGQLDTWQGRYTEETISRAITDAAVSNDAYVPGQIVAIVRPNTRLVEELDGEGKPTGKMSPVVKLEDKDKDGKPVTLELAPKEAVKRMKEMDEYLNLFKGEGTGGLGGMNRGGNNLQSDLKTLATDPAKYRAARKAGKVNFQ